MNHDYESDGSGMSRCFFENGCRQLLRELNAARGTLNFSHFYVDGGSNVRSFRKQFGTENFWALGWLVAILETCGVVSTKRGSELSDGVTYDYSITLLWDNVPTFESLRFRIDGLYGVSRFEADCLRFGNEGGPLPTAHGVIEYEDETDQI